MAWRQQPNWRWAGNIPLRAYGFTPVEKAITITMMQYVRAWLLQTGLFKAGSARSGSRLSGKGESFMKIDGKGNASENNGKGTPPTAGAPRPADDRQTHFVVPWRVKPHPSQAPWLEGDDAGCGSGPVD